MTRGLRAARLAVTTTAVVGVCATSLCSIPANAQQVTSDGLTTLDLCPSRNIADSMLLEPTAVGESYFGTRCAFAGQKLLNISGWSLPNAYDNSGKEHGFKPLNDDASNGGLIPTPEPNKVSISYSTIGPGSAIILHMPNDPANLSPIHVLIDHNNFDLNAAVRFIGSLSPFSQITLTSNQFLLKDRNPFMQDIAMVSAFSIPFVTAEALHVYPNSTITISKNTMECHLVGESTKGIQQHAAAPISSLTGFTFYALSSMFIEDNEFIAKCTPTDVAACAYGVMWSTVMFGENATWAMNRNKFTIDGGHVGFTPVIQGGAMKGIFRDNKGWTNTSGLHEVYSAVWKLRSGNMMVDSTFEVSNNHFQTHGLGVGFVIEPTTVLSRNSHFAMFDNTITSLSEGSPFVEFGDIMYADADSSITVKKNQFIRADGSPFTDPVIRVQNGLLVYNRSKIAFEGNEAAVVKKGVVVDKQSADSVGPTSSSAASSVMDSFSASDKVVGEDAYTAALFLELAGEAPSVSVLGGSQLYLCANRIAGTAINPTTRVSQVILNCSGLTMCTEKPSAGGNKDDSLGTDPKITQTNPDLKPAVPEVTNAALNGNASTTDVDNSNVTTVQRNGCSMRGPFGCALMTPISVLASFLFVAVAAFSAGALSGGRK